MYLQSHSVKEPSKNHEIWVWFCSVLYRLSSIRFGFLHGSVLGKTSVLVRFVLAGFSFFPISNNYCRQTAEPGFEPRSFRCPSKYRNHSPEMRTMVMMMMMMAMMIMMMLMLVILQGVSMETVRGGVMRTYRPVATVTATATPVASPANHTASTSQVNAYNTRRVPSLLRLLPFSLVTSVYALVLRRSSSVSEQQFRL